MFKHPKVNRIATRLIDVAKKGGMTSMHSAAIFGQGIDVISGYNHSRGRIGGNTVLSTHAEMDALSRLLNTYRLFGLKSLMSDERNTTLARKNNQCLLREKGLY